MSGQLPREIEQASNYYPKREYKVTHLWINLHTHNVSVNLLFNFALHRSMGRVANQLEFLQIIQSKFS